MSELLHDANFWVAISFVIFAVFGYAVGRGKAAEALDRKIEAIKEKLFVSEQLHAEAQKLLGEFQTKKAAISSQASTIVKDAEAQAEEVRKAAETALNDTIARKEQQLQERLQRIEEAALDEVRRKAAKIALDAAAEILRQNMNESAHQRMVDSTIETLKQNRAA
ncbi:MAG: hypothetical protein GC136_09785 [Alphaproteobacteria bacterium]|nr:hypothetical protein [Alphaproteobacteria bacterium]